MSGPSSVAWVSNALAIQHGSPVRAPPQTCDPTELAPRVACPAHTVGGLLLLCCCCIGIGGGVFYMKKKKAFAGGGQAQGSVALSAPVAVAVDSKI